MSTYSEGRLIGIWRRPFHSPESIEEHSALFNCTDTLVVRSSFYFGLLALILLPLVLMNVMHFSRSHSIVVYPYHYDLSDHSTRRSIISIDQRHF